MSEQEWRERYTTHLTQRGLEPSIAKQLATAAEYLSDVDPEDAADDELTYIMEDSQ